jgi:hypothetical protein
MEASNAGGGLSEVPSEAGAASEAAAASEAPAMATGDVGRITKTPDERKAALDRQLQVYGAQGWRIENRSDFQATIAKGKEHSHTLHLLLTIFTLGLWGLFVWLPLSIFGGMKRRMITIDEYGNSVEQKL